MFNKTHMTNQYGKPKISKARPTQIHWQKQTRKPIVLLTIQVRIKDCICWTQYYIVESVQVSCLFSPVYIDFLLQENRKDLQPQRKIVSSLD